jgi:hypothetical protein
MCDLQKSTVRPLFCNYYSSLIIIIHLLELLFISWNYYSRKISFLLLLMFHISILLFIISRIFNRFAWPIWTHFCYFGHISVTHARWKISCKIPVKRCCARPVWWSSDQVSGRRKIWPTDRLVIKWPGVRPAYNLTDRPFGDREICVRWESREICRVPGENLEICRGFHASFSVSYYAVLGGVEIGIGALDWGSWVKSI